MPEKSTSALLWLRRDLRLADHAALHRALQAHARVHCAFVFDVAILDGLPADDRRVTFIWHSLREIDDALREIGAGLIVVRGEAQEEIPRLAQRLGVAAVYANRDYEPQAVARDAAVAAALNADGIDFHGCKDQVIFERDEILNQSGKPFAVFTPYKNAWRRRLGPGDVASHAVVMDATRFAAPPPGCELPALAQLGFAENAQAPAAGMSAAYTAFAAFMDKIDAYATTRNFPALSGTSSLSIHLRFGTISIRELVAFAVARGGRGAETWLSELIWREFYMMLLWHHPHVVHQCFKPGFDALRWDGDESLWQAWCDGRTGYPLVDAAMRELVATGAMHNRLRMVTASFLVKDLGIDWRRGEAFFARHLNDFDLAANNGGWQWCASTGCDAQPWFRIFNPVTQSEKFDPQGAYIRRWLPELTPVPDKFIHAPWRLPPPQDKCGIVIGRDYPLPVVDHAAARQRTLNRYQAIRS